MCYFCAFFGYDFYIGQQFEQTTEILIGFSRTSMQKKFLMKTFGVRITEVRITEVRIIEVRITEDVLYCIIQKSACCSCNHCNHLDPPLIWLQIINRPVAQLMERSVKIIQLTNPSHINLTTAFIYIIIGQKRVHLLMSEQSRNRLVEMTVQFLVSFLPIDIFTLYHVLSTIF